MQYDKSCSRCALAQTTPKVCIPGTGDPNASIILYGEAPGETEEAGGLPFIGPAGALLDQALDLAGLNRSDIYITNAVRCRPPQNRGPHVGEQKACRIFTVEELRSIQPKVIVTLGGSPLKALCNLNAVGKARGQIHRLHPDYRSDVPVVATWHPAAALHQPDKRDALLSEIVTDLKLAKQMATDEGDQRDLGFRLLTPKAGTFKRFSRCSVIAVDLEWEVLSDGTKYGAGWPWSKRNGRTPRLVAIGMAAREQDGTVIAMSTPWEGAREDLQEALRVVIDHVPSIYHYGTADVPWLLHYGFNPTVGGDTFVLATLLNINTSLALGTLAATLLPDLPTWKAEGDDVKGRWPSTKQEWAKLLIYNSKDCVATLLLHERMLGMVQELGREKCLPLYTRVLCPAIKTFSKMALNGVRLNTTMLQAGDEMLAERIERIEDQVAEYVGMPGRREITRGDALAPLVEQLLGIRLPRTEKTNKPSLKKSVLEQLRGQHQVVDLLLELSALRKQEGTYFTPWNKMLKEQETDRLHTVYKLTEARTGRSSAQTDMGGTLQQYPRKGDMRRMVIAREGYKLVLADEGQVEMRIGAWISNERNMIRALQEGKDLHTLTGGWFRAVSNGLTIQEYIANPDPWMETVTYDERTAAKIPNFAYLYGGQEGVAVEAARVDYGIELSREDAKRMRDGYFVLYPDLLTWHAVDGPRDVQRGYCESPLGRRRYTDSMPNEDFAGMVRKMVNTPVQATASDLTLAAMVLVDDALTERQLPAYMVGFVHDSIMVEAREDVVVEVGKILKQAMENPMLEELKLVLPVPLVADVEVGDNWLDAEKVTLTQVA